MSAMHLTCLACTVLLLSSCVGSSKPTVEPPGGNTEHTYVDAYLPFLEDVTFPDQVRAGEEFEIALKFSSSAVSGVLGDSMQDRLLRFQMPLISNPPPDANGGFGLSTWFIAGNDSEDSGNTVKVKEGPLPEGVWVYYIFSANSAAEAALHRRLDLNEDDGLFKWPGVELREYRITVLPAQD